MAAAAATLLGALGALVFAPAAAHAQSITTLANASGGVGVNSYLACSVPPGQTFVAVYRQLNVCVPGDFGYTYAVNAPYDYLVACTVPRGFTYDSVSSQVGVCNPLGAAFSYRLRVPATGLFACTIPPGFGYDQTYTSVGVCTVLGVGTSYRLVRR